MTAQLRALRGKAKQARWVTSRQGEEGPGLNDQFEKHGDQVGGRTARESDLSARRTIKMEGAFGTEIEGATNRDPAKIWFARSRRHRTAR